MGRVYGYSTEHSINDAVKQLLKDLNFKKCNTVFVKVNMSLDRYYPGANTSKEFISELTGLLKDKAGTVLVGDSNPSACSVDKAFKVTGVGEAVNREGGLLVNLSEAPLVHVKGENCLYLKKGVKLPRVLFDSDVLISSACVKTHVFTKITSSIKNLFGCLPGRKVLFHPWLNETITDLLYLLKPDYAITDAITGMEENGPVEGEPVKLNAVIGSKDLVSHDVMVSRIIGVPPISVKHLRLSASRGLGDLNYSTNCNTNLIKPFKPAIVSGASSVQDYCLKNPFLYNLCFKTPVYEVLYRGAKLVKDYTRFSKKV